MASPTNQTALTAMVITSLPFTVTQAVSTEPSSLELWYTYTALTTDLMIGLVPYADIASGYEPQVSCYTGPASSPVTYHVTNSKQRAVNLPTTGGVVYLFKVTQSGAANPLGADLTFRLERAPNLVAPAESIIAGLSSSGGFRTPVISGTTDETVYYYIADAAFMQAAIGTQVSSGTFIGNDNDENLQIYNAALSQVYVGQPSYYAFDPEFITSDYASTFYLAYQPTFGAVLTLRTLTTAGAETADVWVLPADSINANVGAASRDGTLFYYGGSGATAVHCYDLANDAPLSDLAAAVAGYNVAADMLVCADASILVAYRKVTATQDFKVVRYSAAGATLNTYTFGTTYIDHIALSPNDDASFWVWLHNTSSSPTVSTYRRILLSDGSTISEANYDIFDAGPQTRRYDPTYSTADSVPLFGPEGTCTFFITKQATNSTINPAMPEAQIDPIRWLRRTPSVSNDGKRIFHRRFQVDFQPGVGLAVADGEHDRDPIVLCRTSDDGGFTWSSFREMTLGERGKYLKQMKLYQLGSAYGRVYEVSGDSPVPLCMVQAWLDIDGSDH